MFRTLYRSPQLQMRGLLDYQLTGRLSSLVPTGSASSNFNKSLDPEKVVLELDKHIIGQYTAKRSVAIAFRNRYRRLTLQDSELRKEIMPANILMKGPTGCGKTEIARRIANLSMSPFIKVEATRYTEVGIVGANTNSMIKDLLDIAINMQREAAKAKKAEQANAEAEDFVLDILDSDGSKRGDLRKRLRDGLINDKVIEIPVDIWKASQTVSKPKTGGGFPDDSPMGMGEDMNNVINMLSDYMRNSGMGSKMGGMGGRDKNKSTVKVTVSEALQIYQNYYYSRNIDESVIIRLAKESTEQSGIVFIDEIDKLAISSDPASGGVSRWSHREGVQKELLSLLEGEVVQTRHGAIKTDHILFIAAGAFHNTSVSDLMPELQGRLPVRVELKQLTEKDMRRVLSEKKYNLLNENKALLSAEGVDLEFTDDAIDEIAKYATMLNNTRGNIGARRLTNVLHTVLEDISFLAHRMSGSTQTINAEYVRTRMKLSDPSSEENLHKYII